MLFSKAYQQLWLLVVTTFIESSHVLPIPLTLAPIRLVLAESSSPHGFNGNVMLRVHCQQALLLLRVLPMEQQVRVFFLLSLEQSLRMLQVATARRHMTAVRAYGAGQRATVVLNGDYRFNSGGE
jgi:hypothetical protein